MAWAHDQSHRPKWHGRLITLGFFIPTPLQVTFTPDQ